MADSPETEQKPTISNTHRVSLPTVLCTPEPTDDNSDISIKVNSIISSDSKMSLPSNLGTPTSPLRLSSPLSLPSSPCVKNSPQSTNSLPNPNPKPMTSSTASNKTVVNSGSATGPVFG
ncbi:hypothetical protein SFRURICE_014629 [Spodoptera frugiperda]|nr:hypothetical protein SFRURICE_014629 [Spodoptera frugiperda]